jgi:hypothetical protein
MLYKNHIAAGETPQEAILAVLTLLRRREPFSEISEDQAKAAALILSRLPGPAYFTQPCIEAEQTRDMRHLTDIENLIHFVQFVKQKAENAPSIPQDADPGSA